jgi:hypothetical protein
MMAALCAPESRDSSVKPTFSPSLSLNRFVGLLVLFPAQAIVKYLQGTSHTKPYKGEGD